MPESKGRKPKKPANPQRARKQTQPARRVMPEIVPDAPEKQTVRGMLRETQRAALPELPEPASYDAVLVAMAGLDELAQEVMIAERLASLPSQKDGGAPVNIPRPVRAPWARQLRKLGLFCVPELATHTLINPDSGGVLSNHMGAELKKLDTGSFWDIAKKQNPALGAQVDAAKTPEEKRALMRKLAANMPADQRAALEKLAGLTPDDLEPK